MGPTYFLFHGVRLFREARSARRAQRAADTPIPGTNVTPAMVAAATVAMERAQAETAAVVAQFGEHPFVRATPANTPDFAAIIKARLKTHGVADWCATCGRGNDGVVHQPTWGRYPDGRDKPKHVWFENDLMKNGLTREEAQAWRAAWQEVSAREGLDATAYDYWDRTARAWYWAQQQAGRNPDTAACAEWHADPG